MSAPDGFLLIGTETGILRALDAQNGAVHWECEIGHPFGGPALAQAGTTIFAVSLNAHLYALRAHDGKIIWETNLPDIDWTVFDNSLRIVASTTCIAIQYGAYLIAIDPADGAPLWQFSLVPRPLTQGGWLLGQGVSHTYFVVKRVPRRSLSSDDQAEIQHRVLPNVWTTSAIAIRVGMVQWSTNDHMTATPPWDAGSSLVEVDGVVYACGLGLHALDAATGSLIWNQPNLPTFHVGALSVGRSQIAVALGRYLGTVRRETGEVLWSVEGRRGPGPYFEEFGAVLMLEVDGEDIVYAGRAEANPDGFQLEAYEAETGTVRWTWRGESTPLRSSWRFRGAGDTLYVPASDGVHGIRATDGQELWRADLDGTQFALLAVSESTK